MNTEKELCECAEMARQAAATEAACATERPEHVATPENSFFLSFPKFEAKKVLFEKTDEKIISAEYTSDEIIKIVTDRETFSFNLKKGKFIDNDNWKKYFTSFYIDNI